MTNVITLCDTWTGLHLCIFRSDSRLLGIHMFLYLAIGLGRCPPPPPPNPPPPPPPPVEGGCKIAGFRDTSHTPASGDLEIRAASLLGPINETIQDVGGMLGNRTSQEMEPRLLPVALVV